MDDTRTFAADLLSRFAGQVNTISIPRPYIEMTGSLEAALLLNQIIYWSDRTGMRDGWFAKSYQDWQTETSLSKYQVMKQIPVLKEAGVETQVKRFNGSPTVHYRLNKAVFSQWIVEKLNYPPSSNSTIHHQETSQSSTETTTETTTKEDNAPSGATSTKSKPVKKPPYNTNRWTPEQVATYWTEHATALEMLVVASGFDSTLYNDMSQTERKQYIAAHRLLVECRFEPDNYKSLYAFAKSQSWKTNKPGGFPITEIAAHITAWRNARLANPNVDPAAEKPKHQVITNSPEDLAIIEAMKHRWDNPPLQVVS